MDNWGIHRRWIEHDTGGYWDFCDFPLRNAGEETVANWPMPSPLVGLRQSFLNGALTRLVDPDKVLKSKVVEFVGKEEFGLASGPESKRYL